MTKTVPVICFFIGVFFLSVFSWTYLDTNRLDTNRPVKSAVLSESINSTSGFGQLLRPSVTISPQSPDNSDLTRNKMITEWLASLEKLSSESVSDWQMNQNKNLIPIPTLIEGVNELVTTPQPTLGPALAAIMEQESINKLSNGAMKQWSYEAMEQSNDFPSDQFNNIQPKADGPLAQAISNIGNLNVNPIKTTIVLAVLGDSMVETLGSKLPDLKASLTSAFPEFSIALLNWGQGATDMEAGLYRLTHTTKYQGTVYPPLLSYNPDILVVESFAYNPWSANSYDLDRQWLTIAKIIDTVKSKSPATKIILASTIAPNPFTFGDGILNWPSDLKWEKAQTIKAYLANLVNFATTQGYPLADAFHPSLSAGGHGDSRFINSGDHLHPSREGAKLFSEKIVEAIKNNNLVQ